MTERERVCDRGERGRWREKDMEWEDRHKARDSSWFMVGQREINANE